ncbi:hypothetical protein FQA39_LY16923 [Lamprigera yunnana]|nr:hypothetical protein FQA39_LY16923 [Lamprigera yunnana]
MAAVVLLVFTFALLNSSKASLDVSLTNNQNVATCTAFLSRWMFEDQKTVVFVYDGFISGLSPNYISNPYISLDIRSPIFKTSEYSNNFVINIRDKEDLRKSIRFLRRSTIWNPKTSPGGKFLVVTTNHNVSSIFNCLWEHNIINSVVLTISSDNLTYYTSNPYHPKNKCGKSVQHFKTNKCEWEVPTELRVKTFNGCEITVLDQTIMSVYKNVVTNVKTRPPLVIFTICLLGIIVTTATLTYYVHNHDKIVNEDAINDWISILKHINQLHLCGEIDKSPVHLDKLPRDTSMVTIATPAKLLGVDISKSTNLQGVIHLNGMFFFYA